MPKYERHLGGKEDLLISHDPTKVQQTRNGVPVQLTPLGAASIPATATESILEVLWNQQAQLMTALSYASQAIGEPVVIYTSNGDGTFTSTATNVYSYTSVVNQANENGMYLGKSATDLVARPDNTSLVEGDLYFNTTSGVLLALENGEWSAVSSAGGAGTGTSVDSLYWAYKIGVTPGTAVGQTLFDGLTINLGNIAVYLNGSHLFEGEDFTYTTTSVTLTNPTVLDDIVQIYGFSALTTVIDCGTYDPAV